MVLSVNQARYLWLRATLDPTGFNWAQERGQGLWEDRWENPAALKQQTHPLFSHDSREGAYISSFGMSLSHGSCHFTEEE